MASVAERFDERGSKRSRSDVEGSDSHDLDIPGQKRARSDQGNTSSSTDNKNDQCDDRYKSLSQATNHAEALSRLSCGAQHLLSKLPMPPFGTLYEDSEVQPLDRAKCPNFRPTTVTTAFYGYIDTVRFLNEVYPSTDPRNNGVCVLSIANSHSPGGVLSTGFTTKWKDPYDRHLLTRQEVMTPREATFYRRFAPLEEQMFYRTSLPLTLNPEYYPLSDTSCIFSPTVAIYRPYQSTGYGLKDASQYKTLTTMSCISIPAVDPLCFGHHSLRYLTRRTPGDPYYGTQSDREWMKSKMRSILRIAATNNQRRIILTPFGCGAFANPVQMVAKMWRTVLMETEFKGWFDCIAFSGLALGDNGTHTYRVFRDVVHGLLV